MSRGVHNNQFTFQLTHDSMSQTSCKVYTSFNDKHSSTRIKTTTNLPITLLPSYWIKHKMSERDIRTLTESITAQLLWLSCLVHGIPIIPSCLKPSLCRRDEIIVSYRTQAIQSLLNYYKTLSSNTTPTFDVLDHTCDSWSPLARYPKLRLSSSLCHTLIDNIGPKVSPSQIQFINYVFHHDNNLYVPTELYQNTIVLRRITSYVNVFTSRRIHVFGLESIPQIVIFNKMYYAMCEDGLCVLEQLN